MVIGPASRVLGTLRLTVTVIRLGASPKRDSVAVHHVANRGA